MKQILIALYLNALKQTGKHTEAYFMIEEQLTAEEASDLKAFIGWMNDNQAPLGPANFKEKWDAFTSSIVLDAGKKTLFTYYHSYFDRMAEAVREAVKNKSDKFITELLNPGMSIELHKVCYPLKNAEVVSYNPDTKEVVLKLK